MILRITQKVRHVIREGDWHVGGVDCVWLKWRVRTCGFTQANGNGRTICTANFNGFGDLLMSFQ